jgi:hypothetical protein
MTITAASDPETVGLDPAAVKRLVASIQAHIDHRPLRRIRNEQLLGAMLWRFQLK